MQNIGIGLGIGYSINDEGGSIGGNYDLFVGNNTTFYGMSDLPLFGTLNPDSLFGHQITRLYTDTVFIGSLYIGFVGGLQIEGINEINIVVAGFTATLTWSETEGQYEGNEQNVASAIVAANGTTLQILLEVVLPINVEFGSDNIVFGSDNVVL